MGDDPDDISTRIEALRRQLEAAWREDGAVTDRVLAWSRVMDAWVVRWHRAQGKKRPERSVVGTTHRPEESG